LSVPGSKIGSSSWFPAASTPSSGANESIYTSMGLGTNTGSSFSDVKSPSFSVTARMRPKTPNSLDHLRSTLPHPPSSEGGVSYRKREQKTQQMCQSSRNFRQFASGSNSKQQQEVLFQKQAADRWKKEASSLQAALTQLQEVEQVNGQLRLELEILRRNTASAADSEYTAVALEAKQLESRVATMGNDNSILRVDLANATDKLAQLTDKVQTSEAMQDDMRAALAKLQVQFQTLNDAHKLTLMDNKILLEENKRVRGSRAELQSDLTMYMNQSSNLGEATRRLRKENESYGSQFDAMIRKIGDLTHKVASMEEDHATAQSKVNKSQEELKAAVAELENVRFKLSQQVQKTENTQEELNELMFKHSALKTLEEKLVRSAEDLERQLQLAKEEVQTMKRNHSAARANFRQDMTSLRNRMEAAVDKYDIVHKSNLQLEEDLEEARNKTNELRDELEAAKKLHAPCKDNEAAFNKEKTRLKKLNKTYVDRAKLLENEIQDLRTSVATKDRDLGAANSRNSLMELDMKGLERTKNQLQVNLARAERAHEGCSKLIREIKENSKKENSQLQAEVQSFKLELQSEKQKKAGLVKETGKWKMLAASFKDKNETLGEANVALKATIEEKTAEVQALQLKAQTALMLEKDLFSTKERLRLAEEGLAAAAKSQEDADEAHAATEQDLLGQLAHAKEENQATLAELAKQQTDRKRLELLLARAESDYRGLSDKYDQVIANKRVSARAGARPGTAPPQKASTAAKTSNTAPPTAATTSHSSRASSAASARTAGANEAVLE